MIENAYLVISVKQIRQILKYAESDRAASSKRMGVRKKTSHCIVLENIEVHKRENGSVQIACHSLMADVERKHEALRPR